VQNQKKNSLQQNMALKRINKVAFPSPSRFPSLSLSLSLSLYLSLSMNSLSLSVRSTFSLFIPSLLSFLTKAPHSPSISPFSIRFIRSLRRTRFWLHDRRIRAYLSSNIKQRKRKKERLGFGLTERENKIEPRFSSNMFHIQYLGATRSRT
jgi:hypothetical protein